MLCPEFARAEQWKARGWEIVLQEARRQVRPDGFHFEQSTYYHVYATDLFLHAAVLAGLNNFTIPKEFEKTLEKMLDALLLLGRSGPPARLGDDDGGRLFDPTRNRSEHLLDPLAAGAVLFHRGDFKAAAGQLREETIWLLGEQGVAEWDRLQAQPPEMASAGLQFAGLYLLTIKNPPSQLVINAGSPGDRSGGHGHADLLSVCMQSQGHALLIDPGTLEYVGDGRERDLFRGTGMHNTLRVDGASQSEPGGPFAWKQLAHARKERWITGETFDLFVGSHDGYSCLASPMVHQRWVFSLKAGFFLVRDLALGVGKHRLDIAWHLGPAMRLRAEHLFEVKGTSSGLAVLCADKHGWSEEVRKDTSSPVYGKKESITVLNFGSVADLPAEFVTLLVPLDEVRRVPGSFTQMCEETPMVKAYLYSTPLKECSFFFSERERTWKHGNIASDAEFVFWQKKRDGAEELLIFCNGSYVEVDGRRALGCKHRVERCEIFTRDGSKQVYASELEALFKDDGDLVGQKLDK
jgi:hypothetical protein